MVRKETAVGGFLVLLSLVFTVLSYSFVDKAIVLMLQSSHRKLVFLMDFVNWRIEHIGLVIGGLFILICSLFITQIWFLFKRKLKTRNLLIISLLISFVLALAYPMMSRDIFSYLFGAKTVILYHADPYLVTPQAFADRDLWFGFTHSVDRRYAYPIFALVYSLIPMLLLGSSAFIQNFLALKIVHWIFFAAAGILLYIKADKKMVLSFWFFNPFLLVEFLVNSHNDVVMVSLFVISMLLIKQKLGSFILFILSVLTKIASIVFWPVYIFTGKYREVYFRIIILAVLGFFLVTKTAIQPWYGSWVFMAMPFAGLRQRSIVGVFIHYFLILVAYIPFLVTNSWSTAWPGFSFLQYSSYLIFLWVGLWEGNKILKSVEEGVKQVVESLPK